MPWKKIGWTLLALLVILLIWGVGIGPHWRLDVEPQEAAVPNLPRGWEGQRVAVLADIHIGMTLGNPGMARRAVARIVRERPALVLIAGDFVVGASDEPATVAEAASIVAPLHRAGIPTYAVLGNHDYAIAWRSEEANEALAAAVERAVQSVGVPLLRNQAAAVTRGGDGAPLYVVGIDSNWAHRDEPAAALRAVPAGAPRIIFMHNPSSFRTIAAGAAPFAVAGHTHGGDVRIPGTPRWSWMDLIQHRKIPADSWAREGFGQPGNRLYINRGIGNSTVPLRINDPPELTFFTLRNATPAQAAQR